MTLSRPVTLGLAAAFLACLAVPTTPSHAFLNRILPSTDTKDEFEGRFIDTITPGAWKSPLEEAMRVAAKKSQGTSSASSFGSGDDNVGLSDRMVDPNDKVQPQFEQTPGLTVLRMEEAGIVSLPVLDAYLAGIVQRLLAHSPITGAPVTVHVTTNERYGNAIALPDGTIAIPIASIFQADSEDEIAALLAHEISHVLRGHHDLDWFERRQDNLVASAELMFGIAAGVAQQLGKGNEMAAKAARILMVAEVVMAATSKGLFPSWTREHEDEADLLGLDLLIAAGYNAAGMFEMMRKMEQVELDEASRPDPVQEKRQALEQEIQRQGSQGNLGGALSSVLQSAVLEFGTAMNRVAASHRDTRKRNDSLLEYFDREYADTVPPAMTSLPLEQIRKSRHFLALEDSFKATSEALDRLAEGNIKAAEAAAIRGVSGPYKNHAWTRHAFAQVRLKQGQTDKARQNLELAMNDPNTPLAIYNELEKLYRKTGDSDAAERILAIAWEEFQRPTTLYARLIHNYYRRGEKLRAQELAIECTFRNRSVGQVCRAAAEGRDPDMKQTQSWLQSSR